MNGLIPLQDHIVRKYFSRIQLRRRNNRNEKGNKYNDPHFKGSILISNTHQEFENNTIPALANGTGP